MIGHLDPETIARNAVTMAAAPPDAKRPLFRELPPPNPFPVTALGTLAPAAEAIHAMTQAPIAICAQSVLAVATLAIQPHRDVAGPIGRRPLAGLFVSVAASGERKSACDRLALKPVYAIEREWRDSAEAEAANYRNAKDAWDEARTAAKRRSKGDRSTMLSAFEALGPEPRAPRSPMLLVADATPEAIALHLADGRPWGAQFTAEGGLMVGGTGMSTENKMRAGAFYNVLWDGDAIRRSRAMARSAYLPGRRFAMHLMMQPNVATTLLTHDTLGQLGTLARLLIVAPESTAGTRYYREPPATALTELSTYEATIGAWLRRPPRTNGQDALDPTPMNLDLEATALWKKFHDSVETSLASGGNLRPIRAWGSKMAEHAMRLAALLAAVDDPEAGEVGSDAMARGIVLAQHYAKEMLRLAGGAGVPTELRNAERLLTWWQARPKPRCHLAEIYQHGPNALREAKEARRAVAVLVEHGFVRPLDPRTVLDGTARREAWELVP